MTTIPITRYVLSKNIHYVYSTYEFEILNELSLNIARLVDEFIVCEGTSIEGIIYIQ